ncbi:MAG: HEAT repeat domain-containing protein [bacterium]|nr:HEAT repeat domain-containing protein [bacterium]
MSRRFAKLSLLPFFLLLALPAGGLETSIPAAGGYRLLEAAQGAPLTVVGLVEAPSRIDTYGRRAGLRVERVLSGEANPGDLLVIAWEEFGRDQQLRFTAGKRSVLALEPLPSGSLWRKRFPAREALAIAARGEAFLNDPDPTTLDSLEAYLRLSSEEREEKAGVTALAALAAVGDARLATAAIDALARIPGLENRLETESTAHLEALLENASRPVELRRQLITLAGDQSLHSLEPALSPLAALPSALQGSAVTSLAQLQGGLSAERTEKLLASEDPRVRAAATRWGGKGLPDTKLKELMAKDPAGQVRAAALTALFERHGLASLEAALPALSDDDGQVRGAAMESIGRLGGSAVPALREMLWNPDADPATLTTPLMTLALTGPEGLGELQKIAAEHPTKKLRKLARFVLGQDPGHD